MKKNLNTVFGAVMKRTFNLAAAVALLFGAIQAHGQSVTFNFQDGTDQGFGNGFGGDATVSFPILTIGGSLRMCVSNTPAFQEAGRASQGSDAFLAAMNAGLLNQSVSTISYDWYIDTSLSTNNGTFLQLGTYINSGAGAYAQDFPGTGKDVELNGTQLASGGVFSGTVTETFTQKYGTLTDPNWFGQTFMRLGLIVQGDGTGSVYFDNITITAVPEPASLSLLGLGAVGLVFLRRRKT